MRPRRSELTATSLLLALASLLAPGLLHAQAEPAGALELVIPVGARAVGMGQAVVADRGGTDAIWWNPASLATLGRRELTLNYRKQGDLNTVLGVTYGLPRAPIGVFALSASMVDYGSDEARDEFGELTGTFAQRFLVATATFATTFARRATAGVNFRVFQNRFDCSGFCGPALSESSGIAPAVDAGVQFQPVDSLPLTIGVAVRNVGPKFQQKDDPQADPLPSRFHVGASYEQALGGPTSDPALRDTRARVSVEVVRSPNLDETGLRAGGELAVQQRFFVRGGYTANVGPSNASVGVGFVSGRLQIDLARLAGGTTEVLGGPPTLLTLRLHF